MKIIEKLKSKFKDSLFETIWIIKQITFPQVISIVLGSAILAFTLVNIHEVSDITEGGIIGLTLLLKHWLNISPAITNAILSFICYFMGYKILGKPFIIYSIIGVLSYSVFYSIFEAIGPLFPEIVNYIPLCTVVGGLLVGISCGLCARVNSAVSGDDALAISLGKKFNVNIEVVYLLSDLLILGFSLTYIPFDKIFFSLCTVVISGKVCGIVSRYKAYKIPDVSKMNKF